MTTQAVGQAQSEEFAEQALGDFAGMMTMLSSIIGDRLGLFRALADRSPATSGELADAAEVDSRYALEWLRQMTAAGYVEYDRATGRFSLPPAKAAVLADADSPFFLGGGFEMAAAALPVLDAVADAFRAGGGVPQDAYPSRFWQGMARFSKPWIDHLLLDEWLPAVPEIEAKLEAGARLADVGCGAGDAILRMADAFPRSTFVGYDAFQGQVDLAREHAGRRGVADRVQFEVLDGARGLPERFDVITTFDVVHDAADPRALLRSIHDGLAGDGTYLMVEIACADDPADNVGPLAALFYGFSLMYCMTTSLASGGAGLGTCGLPEPTARELCLEAGFSELRRLPVDDPFNALYAAQP